MKVSASQLRANIYKILDEVLETGNPVEIERKGRTLRIVVAEPPNVLAAEPPSILDRLVPRPDAIVGDPDDLVHIDWSSEWKP